MRKEAPLLFIKMSGLVSLRVKNNIMQNERPDPNGTALSLKCINNGVFSIISHSATIQPSSLSACFYVYLQSL
jgi:hypothetical protein